MSIVKYLLKECEKIKVENKKKEVDINNAKLKKERKYIQLGYRASTIKSLKEFFNELLKDENKNLSVHDVGSKLKLSQTASQYRARLLAKHKIIKFGKYRVKHGARDIEIINPDFDFSTLVQMGSKNGN